MYIYIFFFLEEIFEDQLFKDLQFTFSASQLNRIKATFSLSTDFITIAKSNEPRLINKVFLGPNLTAFCQEK